MSSKCRIRLLGQVFLHAADFDVLEQDVKIFPDPIIPHHVFYGLVVVNVLVMILGLLRRKWNYDPVTQMNTVISG